MKKLIVLAIVLASLSSCENKSERKIPENNIYILEYVEAGDTISIKYGDKYKASKYRRSLDSKGVWNLLTEEKLK